MGQGGQGVRPGPHGALVFQPPAVPRHGHVPSDPKEVV